MITEEKVRALFPDADDFEVDRIMLEGQEPEPELTDEELIEYALLECEQWEKGETNSLWFADYLPHQCLRIKDGRVQVSNGRSVSIKAAKMINKIRHRATTDDIMVDEFVLDHIDAYGNVQVEGCTFLTWLELDLLAIKHPTLFGEV